MHRHPPWLVAVCIYMHMPSVLDAPQASKPPILHSELESKATLQSQTQPQEPRERPTLLLYPGTSNIGRKLNDNEAAIHSTFYKSMVAFTVTNWVVLSLDTVDVICDVMEE